MYSWYRLINMLTRNPRQEYEMRKGENSQIQEGGGLWWIWNAEDAAKVVML
jgi:hypothetical protein